jgi:uncharacterized membrane protein
MKIVLQVFIAFVAFIILINLSLKVFNTMDAWLGIGMGFVSICAFAWTLYKIWQKTGMDGKEKKEG